MTRASILLGTACVLCACTATWAVKPEEWKHEQPKDFLAGTLENIVVSSLGEVMLGHETKAIEKLADDVEVVNALARAGDGKVYAATGPSGRIYRVSGDSLEEFARLTDDGNVMSLIFTADGYLLAGTGGGDQAKIYRIDKAGKVSTFYEPPGARYVWSMVRGSGGEIYAATGVEGKIHKIEAAGGKGTVLADLKPKNVLCLTIGDNGMLYAGTDEDGLICRINPADGKVFVLYDAKEAEISSIVMDGEGNVYAATAAAESARPGRTVADKPGGTPDTSDTKPAGGKLTTTTAAEGAGTPASATTRPATQPATTRSVGRSVARTPASEAGNVIYRINSDGFVTEVFREPVIIFAMTESDGVVYAGTGNEGRVYAISPSEDRTTMMAKLGPAQATALLRLDDGRILVGTANEGSLVHLSQKRASKGTLVSKPLDGGQIVKWGRALADVNAPAGTRVTIATRSSNVEDEESDVWDDWSGELNLSSPQQISSVSARFIQYRLTFTSTDSDTTPVLRSLTLPRVEDNRAPVLSSLELVSAREEAQKPTAPSSVKALVGGAAFGGTPTPGPEDYWVIKWKAEDPNKDTLTYEVYYRKMGTTRWIQMAKDVKESLKIWDTRTVEDGRYEVRVVAKDTPSNPPGTDLSSARVSDAMLVDNTPPDVRIDRAEPRGKTVNVHAILNDAASNIAEAAYAVNSDDEWTMLAADDDIFDTPSEAVTFTTKELEVGEHWITLRVRDSRGNTRYAGRTVTITGQSASAK